MQQFVPPISGRSHFCFWLRADAPLDWIARRLQPRASAAHRGEEGTGGTIAAGLELHGEMSPCIGMRAGDGWMLADGGSLLVWRLNPNSAAWPSASRS